jgi:hypothetical protein
MEVLTEANRRAYARWWALAARLVATPLIKALARGEALARAGRGESDKGGWDRHLAVTSTLVGRRESSGRGALPGVLGPRSHGRAPLSPRAGALASRRQRSSGCFRGLGGERPPLSLQRLAQLPDGRLAYRLKRPLADGREVLVLQPSELLRRLATLVPPARHHLVRFHGVFAPQCSLAQRGRAAAASCGGRAASGAAAARSTGSATAILEHTPSAAGVPRTRSRFLGRNSCCASSARTFSPAMSAAAGLNRPLASHDQVNVEARSPFSSSFFRSSATKRRVVSMSLIARSSERRLAHGACRRLASSYVRRPLSVSTTSDARR